MAQAVTQVRDAGQLREYAEARLGRKIPQRAWDRLVKDGDVDLALETGAAGDVESFVERLGDLTSGGDRLTPDRVQRDAPGDWVAAREYAVSRVIVRAIAEDERVDAYRREVLGGTLVSPDELSDWLHARYYEDTPPNWRRPCQWCRQRPLSTTPSGWSTYGPGRKPNGARAHSWFPLTKEGRKAIVEAVRSGAWSTEYDPDERPLEVVYSFWALLDGQWQSSRDVVAAGGRLARLAALARDLGREYQVDEAHMVTCILTGTPPAYSGAWASVDGSERSYRSRITLSIDPALTADEVRTFYAGLLRDYFPTIGRHARPAARSMRAAGDVVELFDGKPSAEAHRSWLRRHPDEPVWQGPDGRVPFRQQVRAALRHLR